MHERTGYLFTAIALVLTGCANPQPPLSSKSQPDLGGFIKADGPGPTDAGVTSPNHDASVAQPSPDASTAIMPDLSHADHAVPPPDLTPISNCGAVTAAGSCTSYYEYTSCVAGQLQVTNCSSYGYLYICGTDAYGNATCVYDGSSAP
jgi:hypothetical protein